MEKIGDWEEMRYNELHHYVVKNPSDHTDAYLEPMGCDGVKRPVSLKPGDSIKMTLCNTNLSATYVWTGHKFRKITWWTKIVDYYSWLWYKK